MPNVRGYIHNQFKQIIVSHNFTHKYHAEKKTTTKTITLKINKYLRKRNKSKTLRSKNRQIRLTVPIKPFLQLRLQLLLPSSPPIGNGDPIHLVNNRTHILRAYTVHNTQVPVVVLDHSTEDIPQRYQQTGDFVAADVDDFLQEELAIPHVEEGRVHECIVEVKECREEVFLGVRGSYELISGWRKLD